ncbi:hypothetical protein ASPFODRAFT_55898 [Aspergillus luchuensis CBS 106.47]|uniref:Uncharacterized protein n=1 Tax=Aspergillus luchuensis (strain CBS 106.47) TaxID=1137211 RepID=A0A1M3TZU2_ASPLC|nr:hypothetical protein ASPFODRAFT_55898 [Aspergillus luchuensis CBS 106.47]
MRGRKGERANVGFDLGTGDGVFRGSKQNSRPTAGEVRKLRQKPSRRGSGSGFKFTGSNKSESERRRRGKEIDEAKGKSEGKGVDGQPADTQRRAKRRLVWSSLIRDA